MMRRVLPLLCATALLLGVTAPSVQAQHRHRVVSFATPRSWGKQWVAWALGSNTNPLLDTSFCGEVVGNDFFLNAAGAPLLDLNCRIPHGIPLIATPGGWDVWEPTDATNHVDLLRLVRNQFRKNVSDASVRLDGRKIGGLDRGLISTGAFRIDVGRRSLIRVVDPSFPADLKSTVVAVRGWFLKILPLSRGKHELVLRDRLGGDPFVARFHITVV